MPFKKGTSGNPDGRPAGAKNKLSVAAKEAVHQALNHGAGAVAYLLKLKHSKVATDRQAFVHLVGKLIPRTIEGDLNLDVSSVPLVKVSIPFNFRCNPALMGDQLVRETEEEFEQRTGKTKTGDGGESGGDET